MSLFTILLDHPKGYFPGQNVTGRVILNPKKEIDANVLKIRIQGGAHTKWEERISNKVHEYKSDLSYASEEKVAWFPKNGIVSSKKDF
ncbi:hypothetical protein B9Z55_026267 [Caenorhabditis nigoni]|uniref:Arrestin-like N-terminal domain-containing protein n=1 Tax=Caenorhabditis nigoni TaxID=1611254 RepID=A0A2G5T1Z6_9PELO|nr:hypothetical protein B9Z55_026267 [Caenorhabditis nigoni]